MFGKIIMDPLWILFGAVLVALITWAVLKPRVCIVSLVKEPHQFQSWIDHHRTIDRFYIFMDDDQEDLNVKDSRVVIFRDWKDRLNFKWNNEKDEPANRNEKQRLAFEEASRCAALDGIKYIIHIDSDELLCGQNPVSVFSKYHQSTAFHMKNEELAPTRNDYENCFAEGQFFHEDPAKFTAYGNGKAAGVVGQCTWFGPHFLKGQNQQEIPPEELKVLHYPSCNLSETIKRAKQYGEFQNDSAGWSQHHKETRDVMAGCSTDCETKAQVQFSKRMAGSNAKYIDAGHV